MKSCPVCLSCYDDGLSACALDSAALEREIEGEPVIDGKYAVERRLGLGGMGVIYRVRHLGVQRHFALKLIRSGLASREPFLARFKIEAAALGRLKHANIVDVTDFGIDPRGGGLPYLVMEYLDGRSLQDRRHEDGALSVEAALPVLDNIASGLDFAHERGVLHRDLKPANIFICPNASGPPIAKILDFGLARLFATAAETSDPTQSRQAPLATRPDHSPSETAVTLPIEARDLSSLEGSTLDAAPLVPPGATTERITRPGSIAGTPAYMAPEVFRGQDATRASDIYALGIIVYELLVGHVPFEGQFVEMAEAHSSRVPTKPSVARSSLPIELDEPLLTGLAKDPARRPQRASDLVRVLRSAAHRARVRVWRAREIPRRLRLAALAGLLLAVASTALSVAQIGRRMERPADDARFALTPLRPVDARLLLVVLDDASLAADPTPLNQKADEFGRLLEAAYDAGARAVAIDLLLPQQWSRSEAFSHFMLKHADTLTLAALSASTGEIVGTEALGPLTTAALGPERAQALFGLTNLEEDGDGVVRRARLDFRAQDGGRRPTWGSRAAATSFGPVPRAASASGFFWIETAADWRTIPRISWKDLAERLARTPEAFRDRLVLVGGEFAGSGDEYQRIPWRADRPEEVSGVVLHALIVNTILAGFPYHEVASRAVGLGLAVALVALLAAALCLARWQSALWGLAGVGLVHAVLSAVLFRRAGWIVPVVSPLLAAAAATGLGLLLRLKLSPFPQATKAKDPMRIMNTRIATAAAVLAGLHSTPSVVEAAAPEPIAIVASLSGRASVTLPQTLKREARLFDWLTAGTTLEVGSDAKLTLAFSGGSRYELGSGATATIGPDAPSKTSGPLRTLSPVPPLPRVSPVAEGERVGRRAGVVRIRGARIASLYPRRGSATIPDETTLRFSAFAADVRYRVEVEDGAGSKVFEVETQSAAVRVSPGVLRPGASYYWRVRTVSTSGSAARGDAEFVTLGSDQLQARAALKAATEKAGDSAALALLAEIERSLGLLFEACESFRAALERSPDDAALRAALEGAERQMSQEAEP